MQGLSCVCESVMSHSWVLYFFLLLSSFLAGLSLFSLRSLRGGIGVCVCVGGVRQETRSAAATAVL